MNFKKTILPTLLVSLMLTEGGCTPDTDQRLLEMAEQHARQQHEQYLVNTQIQQHVTEGTRRLVEADSLARKELSTLQRELALERAEVNRQRDLLELERKEISAQRYFDPIIAAVISNIGMLLICLMPIGFCLLLLHSINKPVDDQLLAEVLLDDLVVDHPRLLAPQKEEPTLE